MDIYIKTSSSSSLSSSDRHIKKAEVPQKNTVSHQNRCLAENPFETLGEILPMIKSMFRSKKETKRPAPLFLYEESQLSVPYIVTTDDSSDDEVSLLDHDQDDLTPRFRPEQQTKHSAKKFSAIAEMAKKNAAYGHFEWGELDSSNASDDLGDVFLNPFQCQCD